MRIIDNQYDFYDYLQDPTDTIVFDRRESYVLSKEYFGDAISYGRYIKEDSNYRFVILQCGATFWLLLVTALEKTTYNRFTNYTVEVLKMWKNYDKTNQLLNLYTVSFSYKYRHLMYGKNDQDFNIDLIKENIDNLIIAIDRNDVYISSNLSRYKRYKDHRGRWIEEISEIPLLKACGIGNVINAQEIFCAIEEYFSIKKTSEERTEAIGTTNNDKIVMHGFDVKNSFRHA